MNFAKARTSCTRGAAPVLFPVESPEYDDDDEIARTSFLNSTNRRKWFAIRSSSPAAVAVRVWM